MTKAERDLHLDAAIDDYILLARWAQVRFGKSESHAKRIVVAMAFNNDSPVHWAKLAIYVLTELHWVEQERMLTPIERRVRSIADGVYASCVASVRDLTQTLQLPRAEAKRQLEEQYTRAVFQLSLSLSPDKGEQPS